MKKYFYSDGKEKFGPFSIDEMRNQNINKDTLIWYEGLTDWTSASDIQVFVDILEVTPPPIMGNDLTNKNLTDEIVCPYCKAVLELNEEEQKSGAYTCAECNKKVTLSNFNHINSIKQDYSEIEQKYKGVGGWLLFFCISLTILSPLTSLVSYTNNFNQIESLFIQFPGLKTVSYIDIILISCIMIFSVYAGIALWSIKKDAVKIAKTYLMTFLVYIIISSILPFLAGLPSSVNDAMITPTVTSAIRSIIYFGIWNSYLNKSKRVMATYSNV